MGHLAQDDIDTCKPLYNKFHCNYNLYFFYHDWNLFLSQQFGDLNLNINVQNSKKNQIMNINRVKINTKQTKMTTN